MFLNTLQSSLKNSYKHGMFMSQDSRVQRRVRIYLLLINSMLRATQSRTLASINSSSIKFTQGWFKFVTSSNKNYSTSIQLKRFAFVSFVTFVFKS